MRSARIPHPASRILHAPTTVHYCTVIASIVTDADAAESLHPTWVLLCCIYYNKSIANKGAGCGMRDAGCGMRDAESQSPHPARLTSCICIYIYDTTDSAIRGAISDCTVHTLSSAPLMTRLSQG